MNTDKPKILYLNFTDWTWWVWSVTTALLFLGLTVNPMALRAAIVLTMVQTAVFVGRERSLVAFPVQLRLVYLALLLLCCLPAMHWLFWWPALGTLALITFGYCLLARVLYLLPWNSTERLSLGRLRRTFMSRPDPSRVAGSTPSCAGGLCTIAAQVAPARAS
jgi:hypothetical protein